MRCQGGTPWVPQWPGAPCLSYFTIASGPSVVGLRVSWLLCPVQPSSRFTSLTWDLLLLRPLHHLCLLISSSKCLWVFLQT